MNKMQIPVPQRYCITIEEAAAYFLIGENKLRKLIDENKEANYLLWSGRNAKIKRAAFEKYIDTLNVI